MTTQRQPTLQDPDGRFAAIIEPVAESHGCRLVHVRIAGSQAGTGNALEIFLEKRDGSLLSMETCSDISRELSAIMDVEDPIKGAYRLEVGSAGLDRALTAPEDFIRFKGYEAKIELARPTESGQRRTRGIITEADDTGFTIVDDEKRAFTVRVSDLTSARLVATDALFKAIEKGLFPKPLGADLIPPTPHPTEAVES